ncbi:hypothetical protein NW752_001721 [Fusarium irregulare]|uniref:Uncharacterized protein n=1 Tax=Fusarium irregulare TaxID=2494466 RepID=A0A9W8PU55_9HYPO|nr:hypothetical protein NW766_003885 [Fusarium irregulare]KAJ4026767.1 hypothetical protein NW752_001721 [Fusarium irregulare]
MVDDRIRVYNSRLAVFHVRCSLFTMADRTPILIIDSDDEMDGTPNPEPQRPPLSSEAIRETMQYVPTRPAGTRIRRAGELSLQELVALSQELKALEEHTQQPVTMDDFRRMIQNVFDGWDTSYALGRPPVLSALRASKWASGVFLFEQIIMSHRYPILIIDSDDEQDVAPVPAPIRVQNAENFDPNAEMGPDERLD